MFIYMYCIIMYIFCGTPRGITVMWSKVVICSALLWHSTLAATGPRAAKSDTEVLGVCSLPLDIDMVTCCDNALRYDSLTG